MAPAPPPPPPRPSYFEAAAAARLVPAFKSALLHVVSTAPLSFPHLLPLWRSVDEAVLALHLAVELACLRSGSASFAEGVYGLRRVPLDGARLRTLPSLFWLAVFPYLRGKLERAYANAAGVPLSMLGTNARAPTVANAVPRPLPPLPPWPVRSDARWRALTAHAAWARVQRAAQRTLVATYPFCHAAIEGCEFSYQAAYLVAGAPFFSPYLHHAGVVLARASPSQTAAAAKATRRRRRAQLAGRGAAARATMQAGWFINDHAREALILFVLGFKALEWYFVAGEARVAHGGTNGSGNGADAPVDLLGAEVAGIVGLGVDLSKMVPNAQIPPPVPPPAPPPHPRGCGLPADPRLCPLCRNPIVNPAAAVVSGYVACYTCMVDHVRRERTCPVTCLPMREEGIRRLYPE